MSTIEKKHTKQKILPGRLAAIKHIKMLKKTQNSDSISSRIKKRTTQKARPGRVGGTDHQKLVILRRKESEVRKRRGKSRVDC